MQSDLIRKRFVFTAATLLLISAIGCGPAGPHVVPVEGTVTLDGLPVPEASLTLMPTGKGRPALGTTDSTGRFTLSSDGKHAGAMPGEYYVLVSAVAFDQIAPSEDGLSPGLEGVDHKGHGAVPEWVTPQRYATKSDESPYVVITEPPSPLKIELSTKPPGSRR